jgi:hypothetical protein
MTVTNGNHQNGNGADTTQQQHRILVTGGTGLVGRALQAVIESEPVGSRYGKQREDEQWIFLSSKDGDLRWESCLGRHTLYACKETEVDDSGAGTWHRQKLSSTSTSQHMSFILLLMSEVFLET